MEVKLSTGAFNTIALRGQQDGEQHNSALDGIFIDFFRRHFAAQDVHHDALRRLTKAEIDAKERGHHGENVEDHADDFDPARTVTADELCCDCRGRKYSARRLLPPRRAPSPA